MYSVIVAMDDYWEIVASIKHTWFSMTLNDLKDHFNLSNCLNQISWN